MGPVCADEAEGVDGVEGGVTAGLLQLNKTMLLVSIMAIRKLKYLCMLFLLLIRLLMKLELARTAFLKRILNHFSRLSFINIYIICAKTSPFLPSCSI